MKRTGIMAAMHEEIAALLTQMESVRISRVGMRDYHEGILHGLPCVVVLARIGKVAAAATAVTLVREFEVDRVVFVGLAGGLAPGARVGDVVIGARLLQHDMDASPIAPRHEIPLLGRTHLHADALLSERLEQAASEYFSAGWAMDIAPETRLRFGLDAPRVHVGLIVSGDQFVNSRSAAQRLCVELPEALCVEMEGAAVAQICHEYATPFAVIRTVSDRADDNAIHDFNGFLREVASLYSAGILRQFLASLSERSFLK